jgi:TadE-like protein
MAVEQRRKNSRGRGERGQSLVELALTLPVLLLLLVGLVEVGNALNAYITVVDAGRDGARLGSKGGASDDEIKNLVVTEMGRLPDGVDPATDITVERDVVPDSPSIRVKVCYDHSLILGVPLVTPDPLRICSTTTMPKLVVQ